MICFGTGGFRGDLEKSLNIFLKNNGKIIDSAEKYNTGQIIGNIVKNNREDIYIISKQRPNSYNNMNDVILGFKNKILKDLRTNYIDEMVIHSPFSDDFKKNRIEIWKAYIKLKKDGFIKYIGVSSFTLNHIQELINETDIKPDTIHLEFSLYYHDDKLYEYCKKNNIKIYAYSPLCKRNDSTGNNIILNNVIVNELLKKYNCTIELLTLSWLKSKNIIPIFASSNEEHIKSNINNLFILDNEDIEICDNLKDEINITKYNYKYISDSIIEINNFVRPDLFKKLLNTFPKNLKNGQGAQFDYNNPNSILYSKIINNNDCWKDIDNFIDSQKFLDISIKPLKSVIRNRLRDEALFDVDNLIFEKFKINDGNYVNTYDYIEDVVRLRRKEERKNIKNTVFSRMNFATKGDNKDKDPHRDHENRILSYVLYFNDFSDNEKGTTNFYDGDNNKNPGKIIKSVSPEKNKCVMFLNCKNSIHSVTKSNSNDIRKTIYISFMRHKSSWKYIQNIND